MTQYPIFFSLVVMLSALVTTMGKYIDESGVSNIEFPVSICVPDECYSEDDVANINYEIVCLQNQCFQQNFLSKGSKHRKNASSVTVLIPKKTLLQKHVLVYNRSNSFPDPHRDNEPYYLYFRNLRI